MEKQITKAQALELALKVVDKAIEDKTFMGTDLFDLVDIKLLDKLQAMLEQERKVAESRKGKKSVSKTAKEKAENMDKVKAFFAELQEPEQMFTLQEIGSAIGLDDATPQKLSAIVKPLVDDNILTKDKKDKKVAYKLA